MAIKLIPNQRDIKKLSPTERSYWRGYFDGFSDSAIHTERRINPPEPYKNESVNSVTVQRNGHNVTIYDHPETRAAFTKAKAEAETGGTNHAA